jgi:hypothetical protein
MASRWESCITSDSGTEIAVDWTHFALDLLSIGDFCNAQVIYRLKIQPRLRITAEIAGEPQGRVRRNIEPRVRPAKAYTPLIINTDVVLPDRSQMRCQAGRRRIRPRNCESIDDCPYQPDIQRTRHFNRR